MNISCPHRHVSYSQWRLRVIQDLCHSSTFTRTPVLPFLFTNARALQSKINKRKYSSETRDVENTADEKVQQGKPKTHEKGFISLRRQWAKPKPISRKPPPPRTKFNPYSTSGRDELSSFVEGLQNLSQQVPNRSRIDGKPRVSRLASRQSRSPDSLPQSPVLRQVEATTRRKIPKRVPIAKEKMLENDPWAKMLASPVRYCAASGARLPVRLMTNWGLMVKPDTQDVYLLPNELSDLEHLEETVEWWEEVRRERKARRRKEWELKQEGGVKSVEPVSVMEESRDQNRDAGIDLQKIKGNMTPGYGAASRITPYYNLMEHITEQFTKPKRNDPSEILDKKGAVVKLLPNRFRLRFEEAAAYHNQRQSIEAATGRKGSHPPPFEATFNLRELKWQRDIGIRLLGVLRKRVLMAMTCTTEANSSAKALKKRRISAIPIPKEDQTLGLSEEEGLMEESDQDDQVVTDNGALNSEGFHSKPNSQQEAYRPLAPRFFVYVGTDPLPTKQPFTINSSSIIPPLLSHASTHQNFPVFPVYEMLGKKDYEELIEIIGRSDILRPKLTKGNEKEGYLIQVHVKMAYTEVLLAELWRLWRFIGGRRMLGVSQQDNQQVKADLVDSRGGVQVEKEGDEMPPDKIDDEVKEEREVGVVSQ